MKILKIKAPTGLGHVDEVVSVFPTGDRAPCNFALAYSSPKLGIDLLKKNKGAASEEPIEIAKSECEKQRYVVVGSELLSCKKLIKANLEIDKVIQKQIQKIKEAIEKRSSCKKVKTIAFPQIFGPIYEKDGHYSGGSINPTAVNHLVLGRHLVIPKQRFKPFEEEIAKQTKKLAVTTDFLDDLLYHVGGGNIHCATHTLRACAN